MSGERFKLHLTPGTPHAPNLETEIPFIVGLSPYNEVRGSVEGTAIVSRSVGSRDSGKIGVQESGEIYAKITISIPTALQPEPIAQRSSSPWSPTRSRTHPHRR